MHPQMKVLGPELQGLVSAGLELLLGFPGLLGQTSVLVFSYYGTGTKYAMNASMNTHTQLVGGKCSIHFVATAFG